MKTSTPRPRKRATESAALISARSRRILSMAAAKSTDVRSPPITPNSALLRAAEATRAALMIPFEGTQPTLRQSPPISSRSTMATRAPSPAAPAADTRPAAPAPIATRL
jgi:hypothetical protein